ncbi:MAG: tetratricopeptide repeat protein [Planctomycetota bacterium]
MARTSQKKQAKKQRKLRQRKIKQRQKKLTGLAERYVPDPPAKVARKINEIFDSLEDGDISYGLDLISNLAKSQPNCAAVAETELLINQRLGRNEQACQAAKRLLKLVPKNPEALYSYASTSLSCARASIALVQFKKFLDRFPNHELADKARDSVKVCEQESRRRVSVANEKGGLELDFENGGLKFYARHEESLEQMACYNLSATITLLEQNINQQPAFISSRNNLGICLFHQGDYENAIRASRETCEFAPDNRFAQANLIKFEFLTGNPDKANELAGKMIVDPPTEQDAFTAMVEALSFLGRDEDLIVLSQHLDQVLPDDDKRAIVLHHFAVANYRLESMDEAMKLWEECLELDPQQPDALRNLKDIEEKTGHAAWSESFEKWLPQAFTKEIVKRQEDAPAAIVGMHVCNNPIITTLVPALLDRGDPAAREFAFNFACAVATPPMLAALNDFAFSKRGPDSLRHAALSKLKKESVLDVGPHQFFSRGKWTNIKLIGFEITNEPFQVESWKSELLEAGYWAMHESKLDVAEAAFQQVLDRDPECRSARFNLAGVWQQRQGGDELKRAELEIRKIHADHPDYIFAALAVAIFEAEKGNVACAKELIKDIFEMPKLHISEVMMLLSTQIQVSLIEDDLETAESMWNMMRQFADEQDLRVIQLRERIDQHQFRKSFGPGLAKSLLRLS